MAFNARGIAYGLEERGPLIFRSQAKPAFFCSGRVNRAARQFGVSNGSWKTTCTHREKEKERERTLRIIIDLYRQMGWNLVVFDSFSKLQNSQHNNVYLLY